MPDYIKEALTKFQHPKPPSPQHQPYPHTTPSYGARVQYTPTADTSPILSTADKTRIQQIVGVFLYYARAVDPTMLPALNELGSQQANPTARTAQLIAQFLDYAATHQDAVIRYTPSDMILHVHSDASYLSVINSRSRAAGHFFLSSAFNPKTNNHAIADTGCSTYAFRLNAPCTNIQATPFGISTLVPNGDPTKSTHTASLPIPSLSPAANQGQAML